MATHDYVIANASGSAVRADLNNALAAIVSNNSNATEPATTYAYMWWADTTNGQLKLRSAANDSWIVIQELDGTMLMEDGSAAAPGLAFASDLDTGFYRATTNALGIATNGTNAIYVDASQHVGIGTTAPLTMLHIADDSPVLRLQDTAAVGEPFSQVSGNNGNLFLLADDGNDYADTRIQFDVDGTERARIDSSGRLLVGTSSSSFNARFIVKDNATGTGPGSLCVGTTTVSPINGATIGANIYLSSADDNVAEVRVRRDGGTWTNGSSHPSRLEFYTTANGASSGTERMRIDSNGAVTALGIYAQVISGTTRDVYARNDGVLGYISSTEASKGNINVLGDVDWLYQLQPKTFNYRVQDESGSYTDELHSELEYGLIAEEVEPIAPDLCFYDETDNGQELRGVSYRKLITPLLAALQQANQRIEALEARLTAAGI